MAENGSLTRAETKVLGVLTNPAFYKRTNMERIAESGVSERQFYRIIAKPEFRETQRQMVMDMIQIELGGIVDAAVKTAKMRGKDGHQDRKMLLDMTGMLDRPDDTDDTERALDKLLAVTGNVATAVIKANGTIPQTVNGVPTGGEPLEPVHRGDPERQIVPPATPRTEAG